MKDLKVTVESVVSRCGAKHTVGEAFFVRGGGKIEVPAGKTFCMFAIQAAIPFLTTKQREEDLPASDWVPTTTRVCCPDPDGVVMKVEPV